MSSSYINEDFRSFRKELNHHCSASVTVKGCERFIVNIMTGSVSALRR